MYSLSQRRIYTGERPDAMAAKGNTCFSTPQGWVLVVGEASDAWLWHPLAGDTITLPPIHDDHYIPINCKCLLTDSSAAHPDCAVVLLDVADPVMWFCKVSGGSDRRWGQHTYDIGDYQLPEEFRTPSTRTKAVIAEVAALRGRLHFTSLESRQEKMCIVDLGFPPDHGHPPTAQFRRFDVPDVHKFPQDMCSGTIFLVESLDELFAVCICYVDFDVENIGAVLVYKMDFSGDESQEPLGWRRVSDVGDRALLLTDNNMATWCSASAHNLDGNTIYFLKTDDGDLCIYNIQGQTMETVQVHNQDLEIVRTKPYWINLPPCL
ncbi:hypothetical protein HU200_032508 [Digitaria exilis]|uniref:KIB1-4 beta-propeller domain-containing protein n=1 Tax=Digitaria exilis TaxID=1010633 RepID=A0A835EQH1_9POAL|nr:hypothetical protein HU200_032508 [Digitaria exilis]